LVVFTYYALLPGAVGYSILYTAQKGFFNVGTIIAALVWASAIYIIATNKSRLAKLDNPISKRVAAK